MAESFVVNWDAVHKSMNETKDFQNSELPFAKSKGISIVSMKSIYQIKNHDLLKKRFAEDTKLSKKYENVLDEKLERWARFFNINTEGL